MTHQLKIGQFDISCEPRGEIAFVSIQVDGKLVMESNIRSFHSVIPVRFEYQQEEVRIAISQNCKSYVTADGTTYTKNWFLDRDFLNTAHRSLGLRWSMSGFSDIIQVSTDLSFALVAGYVFSSIVFDVQSWMTFLYSFLVWLSFWLFMDFGRQKIEIKRIKRAFEAR